MDVKVAPPKPRRKYNKKGTSKSLVDNEHKKDESNKVEKDMNTKKNAGISEKQITENQEDTVIKVKNKRGRKPKIKTEEELERLRNPIKKKRGRKPKEKYNFNEENNNESNNNINTYIDKNDSIIIRLPISVIKYDKEQSKNQRKKENSSSPKKSDDLNNADKLSSSNNLSNPNDLTVVDNSELYKVGCKSTSDGSSIYNINDTDTDTKNKQNNAYSKIHTINSQMSNSIASIYDSSFISINSPLGLKHSSQNNIKSNDDPSAFDPYENNENLAFSNVEDISKNNNSNITNISNGDNCCIGNNNDNINQMHTKSSNSSTDLDTSNNLHNDNNNDNNIDRDNDKDKDRDKDRDNDNDNAVTKSNNKDPCKVDSMNTYYSQTNGDNIESIHKTQNREDETDIKMSLLSTHKFMSQHKEWPKVTNLSCLWCCHKFDSSPWGIPLKYKDGYFHMFGTFCSPNCCASFIFDSNKNNDTKWELYSLLNLLYFNVYNTFTKIKLAPSKLCLSTFGGYLSINEYRSKFNQDIIYNIKFPPTVSVIPVIEEENTANLNIYDKNNFISVDKDRLLKANQEFKLQRSKPIFNYKNTLDNCMNITSH